jgi:exoribonuclease-2
MAWEFAPEDEFGFAELARDYFSAQASLAEQAGMLFALYDGTALLQPRRQGPVSQSPGRCSGAGLGGHREEKADWPRRFRPGSSRACRRQHARQAIRDQLYKILFKPDKNAPEYKAVVEASRATHLGPLDLLIKAPVPSTHLTSSTGADSCWRIFPKAPALPNSRHH